MALARPHGDDASQFRIEATGGFREPRTRILKHGDTFAVLDHFGDMVNRDGSPDGLYHRDTRFLSQLELRLNGTRSLLLSSNPADDNSVSPVDLANTDTTDADGSVLHRELIYLNRRQFVWDGAYYELLLVRNFDLRSHVVMLEIRFAADFADIFEVRGMTRPQRGHVSAERLSSGEVALRYRALDGVESVASVRLSPAPGSLDTNGAGFVLELAPNKWRRLALRVACNRHEPEEWSVRRYYRALRSSRHAFRSSRMRAASIETANPIFNELVHRSLADLCML